MTHCECSPARGDDPLARLRAAARRVHVPTRGDDPVHEEEGVILGSIFPRSTENRSE